MTARRSRRRRTRSGACRGPASRIVLIVGLLLASGTLPALGQSRSDLLRDPEDGAFDLSAWLATAGGFLPVVSPVTEPAVGYGASVALAFIHRPPGWDIDEARAAFEARERMQIPSVTGAFGMYTSNNSWGVGGGHLGNWGDGRWRYTGGAGYMDLRLSIARDVPIVGDVLVDYELGGWALTQALLYRLADTDFYVGGRYNLLRMKTRFPLDNLPGVDPRESDSGVAGVGVNLAYDSRNNTFTTDRGVFANLEGRRQDEALGGDFDYWSASGRVLAYVDPVRTLVIGLRAEGGLVTDGVPFWARPGVRLRGVAGGRYTGDATATLESEVRWDVTGRWSLVGFGGAGVNHIDRESREDLTRWVAGGGAGLRYLLARAFGLRGGLDFAWGEDGFAFYVTMGSAWATF
jgi:hypothetical protein